MECDGGVEVQNQSELEENGAEMRRFYWRDLRIAVPSCVHDPFINTLRGSKKQKPGW
jgi:hypothetical protein